MFERFTEKAIKVIMLAQEEARRLGHNFVGTEQILLGLIGKNKENYFLLLKIKGPLLPLSVMNIPSKVFLSSDSFK